MPEPTSNTPNASNTPPTLDHTGNKAAKTAYREPKLVLSLVMHSLLLVVSLVLLVGILSNSTALALGSSIVLLVIAAVFLFWLPKTDND